MFENTQAALGFFYQRKDNANTIFFLFQRLLVKVEKDPKY